MALTTIDDRGLKTPIDLLDNEKIRFGTGNDLEIHHDSSHSYINHNGTGDLFIQTDGLLAVQKYGTTERLINANADGNVELFYGGNKKLETTDTGVSITGDVSIDDKIIHTGDTNTAIRFPAADTITAETAGSERLRITSGGRVGIGVTSPSRTLDIKTASNENGFCLNCIGTPANYAFDIRDDGTVLYRVDNAGRILIGTETEGEATADNLTIADAGHCGITLRSGDDDVGTIFFSDATSGADEYIGSIQYDHSGNFFKWTVNGAERMRIDNGGKVGISTTAPGNYYANKLVVDTLDNEQDGITIVSDTTKDGMLAFADGTSGDARYRGFINYDHNIDTLSLAASGSPVLSLITGKATVTGQCDATCFTGDSGTAYGYAEISDTNRNVTDDWSKVLASHQWALPGAGVYKLQATVRVRIWDENAWVAARYNGDAGAGHAQMLFESGEAEGDYNSSCHILWVYTATGADTVDLEFKSSTSNAGTSIQNDANGRQFMLWERIG